LRIRGVIGSRGQSINLLRNLLSRHGRTFWGSKIEHKIAQKKDKMHKTRERVDADHLWLEIETLNWVLNEILVLRRRDEGFYKNT
jgi:hypothetical protein